MRKLVNIWAMVPRILMLIGSVWIAIYSIILAFATDANALKLFGLTITWPLLLFWAIMVMLIPFSVREGTWSLIWAFVIAAVSLIILVGLFIKAMDYTSVWLYLGVIAFAFISLGALMWVATFYKKL